MFDVTFTFENEDRQPVTVSCAPGANLLQVAQHANVAIDAPCSGNGACGKCKVRLIEGELNCWPSSHITDEEKAEGWILSCGSKVASDVTVMVPDIAAAYQSRMQTADLSSGKEIAIFEKLLSDIKGAGVELVNTFASDHVEIDPPTLDDTLPDNERLVNAIKKTFGVSKVTIPFSVTRDLARNLRENDFRVRIVGEHRGPDFFVYGVTSYDDHEPLCGLAIDIGTTTVSAVLVNLKGGDLLAKASSGNGQIRYGADVINRIIEQGKTGGVKRLKDAVVCETIEPLITKLCETANVSPSKILKVCVASNTTMNHLLLGVDANPVRMEPYIPTFFHADDIFAMEIGLHVNQNARLILCPNIGSYVGGDITAGTLATLLWNKEELSLFVDLGTNGEIVFGNNEFMMSCACSAGPAFEGGDISCGMRATDGAIQAVTIDKDTMEPSYDVVGGDSFKPIGLCGSGIIDLISELYRCGIVNSKGKYVREGDRVKFDEYGMGRYIIVDQTKSETGREIALTEVDIESFIRAKGAIYSGIDTLLSSLDMDASCVEHFYVAGGIGSGINIKNAINIGMFPDIELDKYEYIGNSSLAGAYTCVLSRNAEKKVNELARNMTYLELSTYPGYMDNFIAACFLPHTDLSRFPNSVQEL
ncbi:MAG: ASKHA domain-containing protein [Clostridia bacterium]|nr:ASKHA domain-containing protein [Clostridia bacterium]